MAAMVGHATGGPWWATDQVSSVKVRHLDPEWGETFDLPVANAEEGLQFF